MFTEEKSNTGRQLELDVARGLAIFFMILVHVQLYFSKEEVISSWFGKIIDFVGGLPAAPMFMFLLGVGVNYTKHEEPKVFFKRGLMLLAGGYILNFLRGFLPYLINYFILRDLSFYYGALVQLFSVDIFQFAGLAMIFFGLLKYLREDYLTITICAIAFALSNIFLSDINIDNFWASLFIGLIWGASEYSYFPFLTWIFYPLTGYLFGCLLIRCQDKRKFYIRAAIASALFFFGGIFTFNWSIGLQSGLNTDIAYYHHFFTDNITFTAFVILEISLISFIMPYIPKGLIYLMTRWSMNATPIYFIHWILIGWTALIIAGDSLSYLSFIILSIVIIVISNLGAEFYRKFTEGSSEVSKRVFFKRSKK
ncbi:heparan-alpha-glucosaminide N-acetyltransferase domain-containing protein [Clostridium culturomicium]|uniref:heparan-alpha-glucosaminide N-acetyltransferase domain-containing protein n=1 Tax=Clostridium culturomicium TaxID=1499683 RepID=UPI00058CC926|nr:heparan-alpha-glucosaminide N-acetyltransferase domain-containing protein [Clostridium culturomicium]